MDTFLRVIPSALGIFLLHLLGSACFFCAVHRTHVSWGFFHSVPQSSKLHGGTRKLKPVNRGDGEAIAK